MGVSDWSFCLLSGFCLFSPNTSDPVGPAPDSRQTIRLLGSAGFTGLRLVMFVLSLPCRFYLIVCGHVGSPLYPAGFT